MKKIIIIIMLAFMGAMNANSQDVERVKNVALDAYFKYGEPLYSDGEVIHISKPYFKKEECKVNILNFHNEGIIKSDTIYYIDGRMIDDNNIDDEYRHYIIQHSDRLETALNQLNAPNYYLDVLAEKFVKENADSIIINNENSIPCYEVEIVHNNIQQCILYVNPSYEVFTRIATAYRSGLDMILYKHIDGSYTYKITVPIGKRPTFPTVEKIITEKGKENNIKHQQAIIAKENDAIEKASKYYSVEEPTNEAKKEKKYQDDMYYINR